nr:hypothetical protein [Tanacetum cinerariifolium]
FHTKSHDNRCKTQNNDVSLTTLTPSFASSRDKNPVLGNVEYYGRVLEIIKLDYWSKFKVVLFRCKCYQVEKDELGLSCVNFNKLCCSDDPFVMPFQVHHVFYVPDPIHDGLHYVVNRVPRDLFDFEDESSENVGDSYWCEPTKNRLERVAQTIEHDTELLRKDMPPTVIDANASLADAEEQHRPQFITPLSLNKYANLAKQQIVAPNVSRILPFEEGCERHKTLVDSNASKKSRFGIQPSVSSSFLLALAHGGAEVRRRAYDGVKIKINKGVEDFDSLSRTDESGGVVFVNSGHPFGGKKQRKGKVFTLDETLSEQAHRFTLFNSDCTEIDEYINFASSRDKNPVLGNVEYYGRVLEIIKLDYRSKFKVVLFRCKCYQVEKDELGLSCVNFNKLCCSDDPFVMPFQVHHVFYVPDPIHDGLHYVVNRVPRDLFDFEDESSENVGDSYWCEPTKNRLERVAQTIEHDTELLRKDTPPTVIDANASLVDAEEVNEKRDESDYDDTLWDWMLRDEDNVSDLNERDKEEVGYEDDENEDIEDDLRLQDVNEADAESVDDENENIQEFKNNNNETESDGSEDEFENKDAELEILQVLQSQKGNMFNLNTVSVDYVGYVLSIFGIRISSYMGCLDYDWSGLSLLVWLFGSAILDDSWKNQMELYMQNREHRRMILELLEHGPLIWPTVEENGVIRTKKYAELSAAEKIQADYDMKATNIILQGLHAREHRRMILELLEHGPLIWPTVEENGVIRTKKYAELSAAEKIQADYDMKATNIILQGLHADIYSLVNHHRVAKDL